MVNGDKNIALHQLDALMKSASDKNLAKTAGYFDKEMKPKKYPNRETSDLELEKSHTNNFVFYS